MTFACCLRHHTQPGDSVWSGQVPVSPAAWPGPWGGSPFSPPGSPPSPPPGAADTGSCRAQRPPPHPHTHTSPPPPKNKTLLNPHQAWLHNLIIRPWETNHTAQLGHLFSSGFFSPYPTHITLQFYTRQNMWPYVRLKGEITVFRSDVRFL